MQGKGIKKRAMRESIFDVLGVLSDLIYALCFLFPSCLILLLQQIVFTLENLGGNSLMAVTHPAEAPYGRKV